MRIHIVARPSAGGFLPLTIALNHASANREASFVQQPVMVRAQQRQIVGIRLPAVRPMDYVMRIDEARAVTARERAAAIPRH